MSDTGSNDFSDHMKDAVEPVSLKSQSSQSKQHASDAVDRASRYDDDVRSSTGLNLGDSDCQPDPTKGTLQEAIDKGERAKDHVLHGPSASKGTAHGTNIVPGVAHEIGQGASDCAHKISHDAKSAVHDVAHPSTPATPATHRKSIGEKVKEALHINKTYNTFEAGGRTRHTST